MLSKDKQLKNDGTPKPRVEADMATDVRLDDDELVKSINALTKVLSITTKQPKMHELSKDIYYDKRADFYNLHVRPETVELLSKPSTRLAIIEDDEDETV